MIEKIIMVRVAGRLFPAFVLICSHCKAKNVEISPVKHILCEKCGKVSQVSPPDQNTMVNLADVYGTPSDFLTEYDYKDLRAFLKVCVDSLL